MYSADATHSPAGGRGVTRFAEVLLPSSSLGASCLHRPWAGGSGEPLRGQTPQLSEARLCFPGGWAEQGPGHRAQAGPHGLPLPRCPDPSVWHSAVGELLSQAPARVRPLPQRGFVSRGSWKLLGASCASCALCRGLREGPGPGGHVPPFPHCFCRVVGECGAGEKASGVLGHP